MYGVRLLYGAQSRSGARVCGSQTADTSVHAVPSALRRLATSARIVTGLQVRQGTLDTGCDSIPCDPHYVLTPAPINRRPVHDSADQAPLSPTTFAILRDAVLLARDEQIRSIDQLRSRLQQVWPESPDEIQLALQTWGRYVQKHGARASVGC